MRTQEEPLRDKIIEWLKRASISEEILALSALYLEEGEQKEAFEKLKKVKIQNLGAFDTELLSESRQLYSRLHDTTTKELLRKFIGILYGIGGATAKYAMISNYYNNIFSIPILRKIGVSEEELISISLEELALRERQLDWENFSNWITNSEVTLEIIPKIYKRLNPEYSNSRILILTAYFYLKENQGEKSKLSKEEQEMLVDLESYYIASAEVLFEVKLEENEKKAFDRYLKKNEDTKKEIPNEVLLPLKKGKMSGYLSQLLPGTAFMNRKLSKLIENFIKVALSVDSETALCGIYKMAKREYFHKVELTLAKNFSIEEEIYLSWSAKHNKKDTVLKYMLEKNRELYIKVFQQVDYETGCRMLSLLYQTPGGAMGEKEKLNLEMRRKIINTIVDKNQSGYFKIMEYLEGECTLSELMEQEPQIENSSNSYYYGNWNMVENYKKINGEDDFYKRMTAYYVWKGTFYCFHNGISLKRLAEILEEQKLPMYNQIHLFENIVESNYNETEAKKAKEIAIEILQEKIQDKKEELILTLKKLGPMGRIILLTAFLKAGDENEQVLLESFSDNSKQVKEMLVHIFADRDQSEPAVIQKLSSKKAAERETALFILKQRLLEKKASEAVRNTLEEMLPKEKSTKLSALIENILGYSKEENKGEEILSAETYKAELLKGGRKRSVSWLYETPMPPVKMKNGETALEEYMQAVLLSYYCMEPCGVNPKTRLLTDSLDSRDLESFSGAVFDKWLEKGAESKKKWVLYFASIYGGTEMVQILKRWISEWPGVSRGAIAAEAVKALALNGTPTALLIVDGISRKFKFRQVKEAATAALVSAAAELSITTEELADKIVPNLGFSESGEQIFDYGTKQFRVLLTPALELEIYDEKGKKVKNFPAPKKRGEGEAENENSKKEKESYESFKELKKQLKTTVGTQKLRLELALSLERKWTRENFENLFVKNPVMHQFAIGLIWGYYQESELLGTFRYMEEGGFNTPEEDELDLPEGSQIGLVHPLELEAELLETWKEQLSDYEIVQPIEQLERNVYLVEEKEKGCKELERFGGTIINNLSLTGKLTQIGWYRGSVLDGGGYYTFYKEEVSQNVGVELEFSGAYVGGDNEDVTIYEVRFYKPGNLKRGGYIYDTIKPEDAYSLEEVPKKFFSETIHQLTKAFASSSGNNPNWKQKK